MSSGVRRLTEVHVRQIQRFHLVWSQPAVKQMNLHPKNSVVHYNSPLSEQIDINSVALRT